MNVFQSHAPALTPPPGRVAISLDELAVCVHGLDPGSRALLDLSLRRRLPLEAMAGFLQTDPFDLARRRARAVARIAAELDLDGYGVIATVKAALGRLPNEAWGVPVPARPPRAPSPVQAEAMAAAARALIARLGEQRDRARREAEDQAARAEQPTVEMDAVVAEPVAAELAELEAGAGDQVSVTAQPASLAAELAQAEAEGAEEATVTAPARPEAAEAEAEAAETGKTEERAAPETEESSNAAERAEIETGQTAERVEAETKTEESSNAADQPTVESDAIVLEPDPAAGPKADADEQPTVESDAVCAWPPAPPPASGPRGRRPLATSILSRWRRTRRQSQTARPRCPRPPLRINTRRTGASRAAAS